MERELQTQLLKELVQELFKMEEMHTEYQDGDTNFALDLTKENNVLTIKVTLNELKDKKEFENYVNGLDDDLYQEVIESLQGEIKDLNDIYESENYKDVISIFKDKVKEIAEEKINYLKTLI